MQDREPLSTLLNIHIGQFTKCTHPAVLSLSISREQVLAVVYSLFLLTVVCQNVIAGEIVVSAVQLYP